MTNKNTTDSSQRIVSVITVCYNNLEGLKRTVESVFSQTSADYEYIIIDGGSTDGTKAYLESISDRLAYWVSEPDKGIYAAMNKGIRHATGRYCNFMNSGDRFYSPNVLGRVVPLLQGKDFYVGHEREEGFRNGYQMAPAKLHPLRLIYTPLPHQATFIRTEMLKQRPYDEQLRLVSDWKQMLQETVIYGASYAQLDFLVAWFETTGLSFQQQNQALREQEIATCLHEILPPALRDFIEWDSFNTKVQRALTKESNLARDLKILRNVIKELPRDCTRALRQWWSDAPVTQR